MNREASCRLSAIAQRAVLLIDRAGQGADNPDLQALRGFDPAAAAEPASDLYLRLRDLEHACGAQDAALGSRLRRLGRIVERFG